MVRALLRHRGPVGGAAAQAQLELGVRGNDWFGHSSQQRQRRVIIKGAIGMLKVAKEGEGLEERLEGLDEEAAARAREEFAESMKRGVFGLYAAEIEATVAEAVRACCADTSVDKATRRARASGIIVLGRLLQGKTGGPVSCLHRGSAPQQ